jgi:hypothetical protein
MRGCASLASRWVAVPASRRLTSCPARVRAHRPLEPPRGHRQPIQRPRPSRSLRRPWRAKQVSLVPRASPLQPAAADSRARAMPQPIAPHSGKRSETHSVRSNPCRRTRCVSDADCILMSSAVSYGATICIRRMRYQRLPRIRRRVHCFREQRSSRGCDVQDSRAGRPRHPSAQLPVRRPRSRHEEVPPPTLRGCNVPVSVVRRLRSAKPAPPLVARKPLCERSALGLVSSARLSKSGRWVWLKTARKVRALWNRRSSLNSTRPAVGFQLAAPSRARLAGELHRSALHRFSDEEQRPRHSAHGGAGCRVHEVEWNVTCFTSV